MSAYTPAVYFRHFKKIYSALQIYPIDSVVKHRPPAVAGARLGGLSIAAQSSAPNFFDTQLQTAHAASRKLLVELTGIEPVTPCLQSRCSPS
jgi:hypothetical protein